MGIFGGSWDALSTWWFSLISRLHMLGLSVTDDGHVLAASSSHPLFNCSPKICWMQLVSSVHYVLPFAVLHTQSPLLHLALCVHSSAPDMTIWFLQWTKSWSPSLMVMIVRHMPGYVTDCGGEHFWRFMVPRGCPVSKLQMFSKSILFSTIIVLHKTMEIFLWWPILPPLEQFIGHFYQCCHRKMHPPQFR